jgi:conjugative transfer relaxase protein TraI
MLSTSVIRNVSAASHYFSASDNYYTREEGMEQSEWQGKGCEKLNLVGEVNPERFTALLEGRMPNGELLGKVVDGKVLHRAGWDLTFIGGDKRLIEAHRLAVKTTIGHIEKSCSQARVKIQGEVKYQNTGNIVAALYHHDLSRAQDPQLHTHSVIMNMTQRQDGKWRSQASQIGRYDARAKSEINGFIERTRNNKRYFGKLYESELAYQVKELGYELAVNPKTGVFEIVGVSEDVKKFFSKRRNQVEAALQEQGLSSGKAGDIATLKTREPKRNVDRANLSNEWKLQAEKLGLNCQNIIDKTFDTGHSNTLNSHTQQAEMKADKAIKHAVNSLARFKTTFSLEELVTSALGYEVYEPLSTQSLLVSIDIASKSQELITIENGTGKTLFMAKSTLDDEKKLFSQLENKKLNAHCIAEKIIDNFAIKNDLRSETQQHIKTIFNDDRVVLLEGERAKTTLVEPIVKLANAAKLDIAILSPNQIGSKHFANQITQNPITFFEHIKSLFVDNTIKNYGVMQFLSKFDRNNTNAFKIPKVIIVDNAHLLSTHQKANLITWNNTHHSKLILLGNTKTLLPLQTGSSIQQIINHGVTTISIPDNQITNKGIAGGELIIDVIQKLSGKVIDVKNNNDRLHAMAVHYSKMDNHDRQRSWLISHQKTSISMMNALVHQELKNNGGLGKSIKTNILVPVFIPEGKTFLASSYRKNNVIRFNEDYKSIAILRGEYLRIVSLNKDKNTVILEKSNGKQIAWHPDRIAGSKPGNVELFSEERREICIGESVVFSRSIKSANIVKGERLTISSINNELIKFKNQSQKSVYIDLNKPHHRHLDYGYSTSLHSIAHEKPHTLIAELPTNSFNTHQRQLHQVASQPKHAWIYTDDIESFANYLEKKTGDKLGAHEVLLNSYETKRNLLTLYDVLEKQINNCAEKVETQTLSRPAVDAIDYAIHHLAERNAGFTHKQIIETAMNHALGDVRAQDLNRAVVAVEKAGILLRGTRNDGTIWTTLDSVKIEREIIALCQKDKGTLEPIAGDELLKKYCDPKKLNTEQIAAIRAITQSKDRVIAIQGYAGTGKTTMLATVADVLASKEILKSEGYDILGLAPTNKAVSELKKRGLPAQTLHSFILEFNRDKERGVIQNQKFMLVIDEASMLSNRKALEILKITHELKSRAVPVGDLRQSPSVESGKPFELIQEHVDTKLLVDIQRQKDSNLKQAVNETINFDFKAAFKTLKNSIIEVNEDTHPIAESVEKIDRQIKRDFYREKRLDKLVADYFTYPKEEQGNIQIITPGHDDRIIVNEKIREQLKINGKLQKNADQFFKILSAESFTQIERSNVTNFKVGNVLRFEKSEAVGIKAGEYLTIIKSEIKHNLLTLKNSEDREVIWQLPKFDKERLSPIEVFKEKTRALQSGDLIRWSRSDKLNELYSTEPAKVMSVDTNKVTVILANQKPFTFDPREPKYQHWDHGHAATVYAVQADTKNIVLAHLESHRTNLTSQPSFLVALTRAVNVFRLYTDNQQALLKMIEQNHGMKLSSLEVLGHTAARRVMTTSSLNNRSEEKKHSVFSNFFNPSDKSKIDISLTTSPKFNGDTLSRIKEGLNKNAEIIATEFLGKPIERGGNYLKFGSKNGSLSVTTKGDKQGWFNDFETSTGGRDMLRFIQLYGGMDRKQAIVYGARCVGILPDNQSIQTPRLPHRIAKKDNNKSNETFIHTFSDYEKRRITLANQIADGSMPLKGTLAEKYLKVHRAIDVKALPEDLRFHPGIYAKQNQKTLPALLSIARNHSGNIQSVEAIFLNPETANKADVPLKKQTIGPKKGSLVSVNKVTQKDAATILTEGVVTGLSIANSLPKANVVAVLGKQMFLNVDPSLLSERIILCLDNDGKNLKTDSLILAAAIRLRDAKKTVSFMVPNGLKTLKQDYNDILKVLGKDTIRADFYNSIPYENFYKSSDSVSVKSSTKLSQSFPITDKQVTELSKELLREYQSSTQSDLKIYRQINHKTTQQEPLKPLTQTRDNELEL